MSLEYFESQPQKNRTSLEENNAKNDKTQNTNFGTQYQLKHDFISEIKNKENLKIPLSKSYAISNNGLLIATINESNNFSIYLLEDIFYGYVRCIYNNTDKNKPVTAISFVSLKNFSYFNDLNHDEKSYLNSTRNLQSNSIHGYQLVIAMNTNLQLFDISSCTFSREIKISKPIISMKTDKLNQEQIFYIENDTRNLVKYNFNTAKKNLILSSVNFFEELADGSLIISTQAGIKYFDKQMNLISINKTYLKPMAFFSLSYQKVLIIGSTRSCYPSFTIFDPLSNNLEPSYKLPYFKVDDKSRDCVFCCSNDGNKSFYIGSSTSNYVVHCISEGDFYTIKNVENVNFPVMAIHQTKSNNGIVAIFGESTISLLKYVKNSIVIENYKEIKFDRESPSNEELEEVHQSLLELPMPSNKLLYAVNLLKNEIDSIKESSDCMKKSIESVLQEQLIAYDLSSQLNQSENQKEWKLSDANFYKEKIEKEKTSIIMNLKMAESKKIDQRFANFSQRFSFGFENTKIEEEPPKTENKDRRKHHPQAK